MSWVDVPEGTPDSVAARNVSLPLFIQNLKDLAVVPVPDATPTALPLHHYKEQGNGSSSEVKVNRLVIPTISERSRWTPTGMESNLSISPPKLVGMVQMAYHRCACIPKGIAKQMQQQLEIG
jgi:hypothetical protein